MVATFEIPAEELALVDELGTASNVSRDEIVVRAIREFIRPKRYPLTGNGFGLWKDMTEDSVAYQRRVRGE